MSLTNAKPVILPQDSPALREQVRKLQRVGYGVRRCSPHHIKIGAVNYFPSTGVITTDPKHRHTGKGFDALLKLLQRNLNEDPAIRLEDES